MVKVIPNWASRILSPQSFEEIEKTISLAEKGTRGEIIPMVVRRSSTIGHVQPLLFMSLVSLFLALSLMIEDMGFEWDVVVVMILWGVSYGLSKFDLVQRFLTADVDEALQVNLRAEVEFYEAGLNKTEGGTGVLIFLSLMERRVVVLADPSIDEKVKPETWKEISDLIIHGMKKKNLQEGLQDAVLKCGVILKEHFPANGNNPNEIRNHLIVRD